MLRANTKALFGQAAFFGIVMSLVCVMPLLLSAYIRELYGDIIAGTIYVITDALSEIWIPLYFFPQVPVRATLIWTWTACLISFIVLLNTILV